MGGRIGAFVGYGRAFAMGDAGGSQQGVAIDAGPRGT